MTDDRAEELLDELLDLAAVDPLRFSEWERTFLESCEGQATTDHLTSDQVRKVEEIYDQRAVRGRRA